MKRRIDLHGRPEEREVADGHLADIEYDTVEVEEHALAEMNVLTIVTIEGRLHPHRLASASKQVAKDRSSLAGFSFAGRVQGLAQIARPRAPRDQLGIERIIELARQHLLVLRTHSTRTATRSPDSDARRGSRESLSPGP